MIKRQPVSGIKSIISRGRMRRRAPQFCQNRRLRSTVMTSEGYSVAARLIEKASVTLVDETLQMAMDLEPAMVKGHKTVQELVDDEMLMGLKPVSQVLSEAGVIVFTPKLRKVGDESVIEANSKLREVAKYASSGSTVVNLLPTGVGGNADNVAMLEKQTGLKAGERINYAYLPMGPLQWPGSDAAVAVLGSKAGVEGVRLAGGPGVEGDLRGHTRPGARVHLARPRPLHLDGRRGRADAQGPRAEGGARRRAREVRRPARLAHLRPARPSSRARTWASPSRTWRARR